jgi:branched-chain amino acid transport system substrate-binding protein
MTLSITRRAALGTGIATAALTGSARAQRPPIRIGVLTDMTGVYAANAGLGSVVGAQLAVDDFLTANSDIPVELVSADLQLKPDVAMAISGKWLDTDGVDLITDVPLSSAAFAIGDLVKQKDKVAIFTGGASADITGAHCGPNHLHWVYDTWSMPHGVVDATVKEGGDTWFFITADYAFGHSLQKDAASFVTLAKGKVLGEALAPFPGTTDFSSFLVQAKASGAKVLGLANGGGDTVNCIKQASEFGLMKGGMKVAGLIFLIHDVHGVGLASAQGVLLTEPFYWNLNDGTRDFAKRPGLGACGTIFRGHALSESGGQSWLWPGEGQRQDGGRGDEGDADEGPVIRRWPGSQGRTGHSQHVSVRGQIARTVERTVGLLQSEADRSGGRGIPSDESGGLLAGVTRINRASPGYAWKRGRFRP